MVKKVSRYLNKPILRRVFVYGLLSPGGIMLGVITAVYIFVIVYLGAKGGSCGGCDVEGRRAILMPLLLISQWWVTLGLVGVYATEMADFLQDEMLSFFLSKPVSRYSYFISVSAGAFLVGSVYLFFSGLLFEVLLLYKTGIWFWGTFAVVADHMFLNGALLAFCLFTFVLFRNRSIALIFPWVLVFVPIMLFPGYVFRSEEMISKSPLIISALAIFIIIAVGLTIRIFRNRDIS